MSIHLNERLAVVETRIEQILEESERREVDQKQMLDKLDELQRAIDRYKGFIGGIIFVISCISAFIVKFGTSIWHIVMAKTNG